MIYTRNIIPPEKHPGASLPMPRRPWPSQHKKTGVVVSVPHAQAPMAITYQGQVYLTFRDFRFRKMTGQTGISLFQPEAQLLPSPLAFYTGSPYDGGHSDLVVVDNHLLVVYYAGNEAGEPGIDGVLIPLKAAREPVK